MIIYVNNMSNYPRFSYYFSWIIFPFKYLFYTEYFALSYSIYVASILSKYGPEDMNTTNH